jgi:hypothetical protein
MLPLACEKGCRKVFIEHGALATALALLNPRGLCYTSTKVNVKNTRNTKNLGESAF